MDENFLGNFIAALGRKPGEKTEAWVLCVVDIMCFAIILSASFVVTDPNCM
jgi:hypothetical protein